MALAGLSTDAGRPIQWLQSECLTTPATELPEQTDDASNNDGDNYTEPTVGFCRNFRLIVDFENLA